jgi:outer membrane protein assembly factor BamA
MKFAAFIILILFSCAPAAAQYRFYLYEKADRFNLAPWLKYNKADGPFLGLAANYYFSEHLTLHARGGYATAGRYPRYEGTLHRNFERGNHEYTVSVSGFHRTQTNDMHVIREWQNSVSALFFKNDYYNFFEARGGELKIGALFNGIYRFAVFSALQRYRSLENHTDFSLLNWGAETIDGKKRFAPNPTVSEGDDYTVGLEYEIDYRPSPLAFVSAWYFRGRYVNATLLHGPASSDFSYHRVELTFKRYQKAFARQRMVVSLEVGSFEGRTSAGASPADQFLFDQGGYATLRGYDYREFANGNRMVRLSADYLFNGSFLPRTPLARIWGLKAIFSKFDLLLFADGGNVWREKEDAPFAGFGGTRLRDFKADAGAGLALADWVRLECAWPLKTGLSTRHHRPTVYLRLAQKL